LVTVVVDAVKWTSRIDNRGDRKQCALVSLYDHHKCEQFIQANIYINVLPSSWRCRIRVSYPGPLKAVFCRSV